MPGIEISTLIYAPVERCFELSISIDVHTLSTAHTGEKAVAGITSGLMKMGDTVTWRARHFGIWQKLTSQITAYNYPVYFCDEMRKGAFKSIRHEHHFVEENGATLVKDIFVFTSPWGILGRIADKLLLEKYMRKLLVDRNQVIKEFAESEKWKQILGIK